MAISLSGMMELKEMRGQGKPKEHHHKYGTKMGRECLQQACTLFQMLQVQHANLKG
jgi:hypothetical protein